MGSPKAQSLSQDRIAREALLRNARFRQYHVQLTVVPGDFDVDDFGVARAQAAQFMAYGAGIVWIVEPLLARMISGPKATPAGIPAGDPRIGSGSKCDAVGHSFPPAFCVRAKPNTEPFPIVDIEPNQDRKKTQPSSVARERELVEGAGQVTIRSCAGRGPRQGGRVAALIDVV
jgi:hypothetical protein